MCRTGRLCGAGPGVGILLLVLLLSACSRTDARPDTAAGVVLPGVSVIAQHGLWPEAVPLARGAWPVRVTLRNDSGIPLRVGLSHFALTEPDRDDVHHPLPPFRMVEGLRQPTVAPAHDPLGPGVPLGELSGFEVAPFYSPLYPAVPIAAEAVAFDPGYYRNRYGRPRGRLTDEMLQLALPEGILHPGGTVSGFIYFAGVGGSAEDRVLRVELAGGGDQGWLGTLAIPLEGGGR